MRPDTAPVRAAAVLAGPSPGAPPDRRQSCRDAPERPSGPLPARPAAGRIGGREWGDRPERWPAYGRGAGLVGGSRL